MNRAAEARYGESSHVLARRGEARQARHGESWLGESRLGESWLGGAGQANRNPDTSAPGFPLTAKANA